MAKLTVKYVEAEGTYLRSAYRVKLIGQVLEFTGGRRQSPPKKFPPIPCKLRQLLALFRFWVGGLGANC